MDASWIAPVLRQVPRREGRVSIAQITDLHLLGQPGRYFLGIDTDDSFLQVIKLARKQQWPVDLVMLTGDLAQEPKTSTYRRLRNHLVKLDSTCICLPGNHDSGQLMETTLKAPGIHILSPVLIGNWLIVPLDSSIPGLDTGQLSGSQLLLLERLLNLHPDRHTLLALHHHPIPVGSAWLDTMVLENRVEFFSLLERHPQVKAVLCGHVHQAFDRRHGNIRILGSPATCFQFQPGRKQFSMDRKPAGYRLLHLRENGKIETEVKRVTALPEGLNIASAGY